MADDLSHEAYERWWVANGGQLKSHTPATLMESKLSSAAKHKFPSGTTVEEAYDFFRAQFRSPLFAAEAYRRWLAARAK